MTFSKRELPFLGYMLLSNLHIAFDLDIISKFMVTKRKLVIEADKIHEQEERTLCFLGGPFAIDHNAHPKCPAAKFPGQNVLHQNVTNIMSQKYIFS